jgi:hypothetical protein
MPYFIFQASDLEYYYLSLKTCNARHHHGQNITTAALAESPPPPIGQYSALAEWAERPQPIWRTSSHVKPTNFKPSCSVLCELLSVVWALHLNFFCKRKKCIAYLIIKAWVGNLQQLVKEPTIKSTQSTLGCETNQEAVEFEVNLKTQKFPLNLC